MKAASHHEYGAPDVLALREVEVPTPSDHDILVQVHASPVTQGDRRLRASDYPGASWLVGRLMTGLLRPRHQIPGTIFAGRVAAVGKAVTRFKTGEDVYGSCMHGAQAEYLSIPEDSALARMPSGLSHDEAAALPYGAVTALHFLRDLGKVQPGQHVLIVGASGGVGRFAVQLARHFGAEVTGVCSRDHDLVRALGATHIIDHTREDFTANGQRYDIIFDTSGELSFENTRASLRPEGRFLSLYMKLRLLWHMAITALFGGPRALVGVAIGDRNDLDEVRELVEEGAIRPLIDRRYPLEHISQAHGYLETARPFGSVMMSIAPSSEATVGHMAA